MRLCINGKVHIVLVTNCLIKKGEHLCYDYRGNFGQGNTNLCTLEEVELSDFEDEDGDEENDEGGDEVNEEADGMKM